MGMHNRKRRDKDKAFTATENVPMVMTVFRVIDKCIETVFGAT